MKQIKRKAVTQFLLLLLVAAIGLTGCGAVQRNAAPAIVEEEQMPEIREVEIVELSNKEENVIYLAGGCFWGLEQLMQSMPTEPGNRMLFMKSFSGAIPASGKQ